MRSSRSGASQRLAFWAKRGSSSDRLDQLPKEVAYLKVTYTVPGSKRSRQLLVGVSGGIESSDVLNALYAARLHDWTFSRAQPWRLFVHGNASHVQITVKDGDTCFLPSSPGSYSRKGNFGCCLTDRVLRRIAHQSPCEFIVPPPTEYAGRASNKSLERTRDR